MLMGDDSKLVQKLLKKLGLFDNRKKAKKLYIYKKKSMAKKFDDFFWYLRSLIHCRELKRNIRIKFNLEKEKIKNA